VANIFGAATEFRRFFVGYTEIVLDKVYEYPKNVGIIVNRNTASASEHYVITARQSRKVTIFGETTMGAIDTALSGFGDPVSPCGEIILHYNDLRYTLVSERTFDDIGVQPDIFIDSSVPDYRWVEHVTEIMNSWAIEPEPRRRRVRR